MLITPKEYLILFSTAASLILGLSIYLKERSKQERIHFLIFTIIITFWSSSLYFYNRPILLESFAWLKITLFLTAIAILELICFIISFSQNPIKKFWVWLVAYSLVLGAVFTEVLLNKSLMLIPPQAMSIFLLVLVYGFWGSLILFGRTLKTAGIEHLKITYILVDFGIFLILTTILYAFGALIFPRMEYLWLEPLISLLFVGSVALLVTRRRSSEMSAIPKEFLVIFTGIILLALPFLISNFNLKILTTVVFVLFCVLGYFLFAAIHKESKRSREMEKLTSEWGKLSQAKDQFLLSLQHHLRTPITPIKGYLEMILAGTYGELENSVIREKLIEIKKLVDTLYSLIENLLDIQELRTGKKILHSEDCQIENLIDGIVEELQPQAEEKGIYLKFNKINLPKIRLDKRRIREAIWNLVDNAIKYTNRGGVTITPKIENRKLKIAISDTGIGMTKEEIKYFLKGKLFERGREAKKLYGPGRGMGLSLAIEFIKAHGGKVWAESKGQRQGTTFWIEIPTKETGITR